MGNEQATEYITWDGDGDGDDDGNSSVDGAENGYEHSSAVMEINLQNGDGVTQCHIRLTSFNTFISKEAADNYQKCL